jgi:polyketide cyclase/dehydrase/lipid transport protein
MRRVTASIDIDAPAQDVWDLYVDVPRTPDWVPFSERILFISGPPGLGQVYRERTRLLGISDVAEWRIIEWEPPRRQVQLSTDKRMDARLVIEVEPLEPFDAGRSRVRQEAIFESRLRGPLARVHELLFASVGKRGITAAVQAAKAHLESRESASEP